MIETIEEARKTVYGKWAGNPKGTPYKEGKCVAGIYSNYRRHQCPNKNGKGPGDLYCGIHDPVRLKKRRDEQDEKWHAKMKAARESAERRSLEIAYCAGLTNEQLEARR